MKVRRWKTLSFFKIENYPIHQSLCLAQHGIQLIIEYLYIHSIHFFIFTLHFPIKMCLSIIWDDPRSNVNRCNQNFYSKFLDQAGRINLWRDARPALKGQHRSGALSGTLLDRRLLGSAISKMQ